MTIKAIIFSILVATPVAFSCIFFESLFRKYPQQSTITLFVFIIMGAVAYFAWDTISERQLNIEAVRAAEQHEKVWQEQQEWIRRRNALCTASSRKAGRSLGMAGQMMAAEMDREFYEWLMRSPDITSEMIEQQLHDEYLANVGNIGIDRWKQEG
jgi:hypothetical protein